MRRSQPRPRWLALGPRLLPVVALCGLVLLAACAQGSGARATATPAAARPTAIAAQAGDTRLCAVVTPAEFAGVVGAAANQVTPGSTTDSLTGLREVYCVYLDTSDPQANIARGTINFEIAADARSAADTFQSVKQSFTGVTNVDGAGDAAFAGTPNGANAGTGLVVVRGSLLLYVSVGGDPQTVARAAKQLAALALARVAA